MKYLIQIYSRLDYLTEVDTDTVESAANQAMLNLRDAMDAGMVITGARPEMAVTPDGRCVRLDCPTSCVLA